MSDSPAKHPHSEDQICRADDHDRSTSEHIQAQVRAKWSFFLLGCTILLPSNALVNGTSFFLSRMIDSPLYSTFTSSLSSIFTLSKLASQLYCMTTLKQSSSTRRTFVSLTAMILLVTSLSLSTCIRGTSSSFFLFALCNAALLGVSAGCLCTATYAGASLFGPSILQTVLSGQGAIAVAASAVHVASSLISIWGPSPPKASPMVLEGGNGRDSQAEEAAARIFFGVCAIFLGITLISYTSLTRQPFFQSVVRNLERRRGVGDADELTGLLADGNPQTDDSSHIYRVLKQNLIFMFSIAYAFTVTMSVFPAITVRVQSVNPGVHPLLFTAIHAFVFSIGDLAGRHTCSFPSLLVWSAKKILAMSLLRTLFVPLILLCNVRRLATPAINSDVLFMIILFAMGYTSGYVSTVGALAASSLEHNPRLKGHEDVSVAATLSGLFAIVGLTSGSLCSFIVLVLV